ncbi:MAG: Major facilitator superfamily [Candidatus Uhrbacteria bacterium GW2011_GWF2_39_13]|uniref:Major facilitator superfamily n=1 Tax=Candidatus Uhrbacteria bacterium GW2011_GWF2_39_13 TaxID=1618995 RepID=A0A0G0MLE5_9BACT|nr:MAG: Major facilitator superfamily [Candidatus Uhrbacteria bacterium GW2011_GWF2_39_13]
MSTGNTVPPSPCAEKGIYRAGTLTYTKYTLATLFIWMLWGDFCFVLMEALIPQLLPLSLKNLNASNALIGLFVGSLSAAINMIICPIVSFRSDRTRSRFGRRIPYLFFATPFVAFFLILVGWSPQLGSMLNRFFPCGLSPVATALVLVAVFCVCFQFFNMFVASVFYYLFTDVVPEQFMGRFMALFRVVGAAAGFCFTRYILGLADNYMPWIYTGIAILYFVSFMLMCWRVKEGEYPPPTDTEERKNFFCSFKLYFKECFSNPYYCWFFLGTALNAVSVVCRTMFNIFFAKENLGMSLAEYGKIASWGMLLGMVLYLPLGYLVDKLHPLRVYISGIILVVLTNIFGFILIDSYSTFFVFTMLFAIVYAIQSASNLPMYACLLPKERWGQFCSAQAMLQAVMLIAANYGGGLFMDIVGDYRFIYAWDAVFTAVALFAMIMVYRGWQRYGGRKNYVAPL